MPKQRKSLNLSKLHDVVADECKRFYKYGGRARASDVAAIIRSDHPELYQDFVGQLADQQLRRMCAKVMKSWQAVEQKGESAQQFKLPGLEHHIGSRLPPAISIPVEGDIHDILFVPAAVALPSEWRQHLEYLGSQHEAIGKVMSAIRELLERGADCPQDVPLVQFVGNRSPVDATGGMEPA